MSDRAIRVGIVGMGGFAQNHHKAVAQLERSGRCRLICACDPERESFADRARELDFEPRGVRFHDHYLSMLDAHRDELDLVTIPTPIPLHAPMHRACVERGLPVYLEKPPTLSCEEMQEMLAVEAGAELATNVGFNFTAEAERQALKQRILDGEFGRLHTVSILGLTPRPRSYFARAPWAARLIMDGRLVLDSCFGNAMAHLVHNVLFWAGSGEVLSWAQVEEVEAELYRARGIQGFDTCFARARTSQGPDILVAMSHSCEPDIRFRERVHCERATITYSVGHSYRVDWANGREEAADVAPISLTDNIAAYLNYVGGKTDRPLNRLVDCSPFVTFNSLLYVASGAIHTVPTDQIDLLRAGDPAEETPRIIGLLPACETFLRDGVFPAAQGAAWAKPGRKATPSEVSRLRDVVTAMAQGD